MQALIPFLVILLIAWSPLLWRLWKAPPTSAWRCFRAFIGVFVSYCGIFLVTYLLGIDPLYGTMLSLAGGIWTARYVRL